MTQHVRSVWNRTVYQRDGDGVAFDRVVFFSDAVFAIALTLAAVEIGIPRSTRPTRTPRWPWNALVERGPRSRPTSSLFCLGRHLLARQSPLHHDLEGDERSVRRCGDRLPGADRPAADPRRRAGRVLAEPTAVAVFAVYASAVSAMEVVLLLIADRDGLFVAPLSPAFRRAQVIGSLSPVVVFLTSILLAFVSTGLALTWWVVGSVAAGFTISRLLPAEPPPDQPGFDSPPQRRMHRIGP